MGDLDDSHPEAVSLCCRSVGEILTGYGQTDLAKLSKRQFREMIKGVLATWEAERGK